MYLLSQVMEFTIFIHFLSFHNMISFFFLREIICYSLFSIIVIFFCVFDKILHLVHQFITYFHWFICFDLSLFCKILTHAIFLINRAMHPSFTISHNFSCYMIQFTIYQFLRCLVIYAMPPLSNHTDPNIILKPKSLYSWDISQVTKAMFFLI